ncbi:MAG: 7TM-DISM domain-containing protein, partial [Ketobacteraceae bacterium]|nr:7TM-DISM domain-containing protein [Ketobacteraceae bacterium]
MMRFILAWVLVVFPLAASALNDTPLLPSPKDYRVYLGGELVSYKDDTASLDFRQVWQMYQRGEVHQPSLPSLQYGYSEAAFWFVTVIENRHSEPVRNHLEIRYPPLDNIDVYLLTDIGDLVSHSVLVERIPYHYRKIDSRFHVAPLKFDPGKRFHLLVRVVSESSLLIRMYLSSIDQHYEHEHYQQIA